MGWILLSLTYITLILQGVKIKINSFMMKRCLKYLICWINNHINDLPVRIQIISAIKLLWICIPINEIIIPSCAFVFITLDTMPLTMRLSVKSWERNYPKEQRKTWTISVPRQMWHWRAADDRSEHWEHSVTMQFTGTSTDSQVTFRATARSSSMGAIVCRLCSSWIYYWSSDFWMYAMYCKCSLNATMNINLSAYNEFESDYW